MFATITKKSFANPPMNLVGPQNLRELGGYPRLHGGATAMGRLLRSDSLQDLSRSDRRRLFSYGLRCVIDLRSEEEAHKSPDCFDDYPDVRCFRSPMFTRLPLASGGWREPDNLAELYAALLEGAQDAFLSAMRGISRAGYGCVLFHCAGGKDRTGLVAMLLLMLAGVPEEIIIEDYCTSCDNMAVSFARQKLRMHAAGLSVNEALFRSSPADIEAAMEHLYTRWGGAEGYLYAIGCDDREVEALRQILRNPELQY